MPGINVNMVCHHLALNLGAKPIVEKRIKLGEERRKAMDVEVKS